MLMRNQGGFAACEDAVQEALLAAAVQWPEQGMPDNPKGWLTTVAYRRWTESWRNETARRRREETVAMLAPVDPEPVAVDDTLTLLLLCCHPSLTRVSQVALTLRAVGGLTTPEIARAFLVPESTVAQRISRAKHRIKTSGLEFRMPSPTELPGRVAAVMEVLYLIFNEGYTASSGSALNRVELTAEAIRLARQLHERLPEDGEVTGLLALMLLTDARRPARLDPDGMLVPLTEQDRRRWDAAAIREGIDLISRTLPHSRIGPYQVQAAIAAVHCEAARVEDTDWRQILGLYDVLTTIAPGPMVTLNRIVAVAMVHGPETGLAQLAVAEADPSLAGHHRTQAVRAHLLELAGDHQAARVAYELAAGRTLSIPEQRYLHSRAARLAEPAAHHGRRRSRTPG
ncbi:sigma factor-like helix-turn-helix DNA-binding protein [Actinomadura fulvescens]|uniref:Sigma factor-like helix-turn-helix DNA-binding protein n=1 Tax=Actinomadura fulvescens TaxID=46160 RepID=A0ABN3PTL5_9ACTN